MNNSSTPAYNTTGNDAIVNQPIETFKAILFIGVAIFTILTNTMSFVFYLRFGVKNAHGFFIMSLCVGNSIIGFSILFAVVANVVDPIPYFCISSVFCLTLGMLFNIVMTFWICLERYIIVHNISTRNVAWMERRRTMIVILTGIAIILYLMVLFINVQNSASDSCDAMNIFLHLVPVYIGMMSFPMACFFIATVTLYIKILRKIRKFSKEYNNRSKVSEEESPNKTSTFKMTNVEIQQTSRGFSMLFPRESESKEDGNRGTIHLRHIDVWDSEKVTKSSTISWQKRAEKTVRMLIGQISIYYLSFFAGQLAGFIGLLHLRPIFVSFMLLCVLISPFLYVMTVTEVREAMKRAFGCMPNSVDADNAPEHRCPDDQNQTEC